MITEYRIRKLRDRRAKYQAEYNFYRNTFSGVPELNSYHVDKMATLAGLIGEIDSKLNHLESSHNRDIGKLSIKSGTGV